MRRTTASSTYPSSNSGQVLGSTVALSDSGGTRVGGVTRYYPFGDFRTAPTQTATDRGFTEHRHNNLAGNDLGLIYMNARYYVVLEFIHSGSVTDGFYQTRQN
jgi:hypothetical protein